jgi:hypothetical protein
MLRGSREQSRAAAKEDERRVKKEGRRQRHNANNKK